MRPSKLYYKIFLSFLGILIITEIAIFGLFVFYAGRQFRQDYERYNQSRFQMAKEMLEFQVSKTPIIEIEDNPLLIEYVNKLGHTFKTRIWITSSNNEVLYKSFPGKIPSNLVERYKKQKVGRNYERRLFRKDNSFVLYRNSPIQLVNEKVTFHMVFHNHPPFEHKGRFALGLIAIGLFIAVLIFPVSRLISKPIKILTNSTKRLESGDLGHRTKVKTKDEIGELASAFNRMAEKIEGMVKTGKELTAQVSHELRSPLARIQIAVELLKDRLHSTTDTETVTHLKEIQEDVEELDRLIGRILELSKLDLQESESYSEVFSPIQLLQETFGKYDSSLTSKKVSTKFDLKDNGRIIGNRASFSTALCNLVDNAYKYTPVNGKIEVQSVIKNENIVLSISNSCLSVKESELENLFKPFYRIDLVDQNGGGLGLAITRKIIEKHKGQISVKNTEMGLEFTLSLPMVSVT